MAHPLTTSAVVTSGPWTGDEIVAVDQVTIDGMEVQVPTALPGVVEYVSVAHSEAEANRLRPQLLQNLDTRGPVPYQPDADLVFSYYGAAASTAGSAIAGLESFANHHISRFCPPPQYDAAGKVIGSEPTIELAGTVVTFHDLANLPLNERYSEVLPALLDVPKPTTERWWPVLRRIQGLAALQRHGIIDSVKRAGLDGKKKLVQRFCDREYRGAAKMMLELFEYFAPGWISEERMPELPSAPES